MIRHLHVLFKIIMPLCEAFDDSEDAIGTITVKLIGRYILREE